MLVARVTSSGWPRSTSGSTSASASATFSINGSHSRGLAAGLRAGAWLAGTAGVSGGAAMPISTLSDRPSGTC